MTLVTGSQVFCPRATVCERLFQLAFFCPSTPPNWTSSLYSSTSMVYNFFNASMLIQVYDRTNAPSPDADWSSGGSQQLDPARQSDLGISNRGLLFGLQQCCGSYPQGPHPYLQQAHWFETCQCHYWRVSLWDLHCCGKTAVYQSNPTGKASKGESQMWKRSARALQKSVLYSSYVE